MVTGLSRVPSGVRYAVTVTCSVRADGLKLDCRAGAELYIFALKALGIDAKPAGNAALDGEAAAPVRTSEHCSARLPAREAPAMAAPELSSTVRVRRHGRHGLLGAKKHRDQEHPGQRQSATHHFGLAPRHPLHLPDL